MRTLTERFRVVGISSKPYRENAQRLHERLQRTQSPMDGAYKFPVMLVPEPENRFDPSAILVVAETPFGPLPLGYVPARRYCPLCDPDNTGRGYRTYADAQHPVIQEFCENHPKQCLTRAMTELLRPVLENPTARVNATGFFIGGVAGRENLGVLVEVTCTIVHDEVTDNGTD